ncbi:hypothetical protein [Lampropedia cohaerens]|uniref:hypothetical protein n=1 Tax=Lampropedia cohaerens TaxID=1610491 RepID=UPI0012E393A6|nr:hypothetical protein [Lampropedia cohaerens]
MSRAFMRCRFHPVWRCQQATGSQALSGIAVPTLPDNGASLPAEFGVIGVRVNLLITERNVVSWKMAD